MNIKKLPGTDFSNWEQYIDEQQGRSGYQNGGYDGFSILNHLFSKPRTGYKNRGVPLILCETVGEHCLRLERVCKSIIEGTPGRVENPYRIVGMARYHDLIEYPPEVPDITPHCNYTRENKKEIEVGVQRRIELILGERGKEIIGLIDEYQKQETNDSKELYLHDKIIAGVGAFEYEKLGFSKQMENFHTAILELLEKDKYLKSIYEILLEREFKYFDFFIQYYILLQLAGNYKLFRETMTNFGN